MVDFKGHLYQFKADINKKSNSLLKIINQSLPEILVIVGLFFIIKTTFKINTIAGMYLTGIILLLIGLFLAGRR